MNGIHEFLKSESVQNASQPIGTVRKCRKCGNVKSIDKFYKDRRLKSGLRAQCKACVSAYRKLQYRIDPTKAKTSALNRYKNDPQKAKVNHLAWTKANPSRMKLYRSTPYGALNNRMSTAIYAALKGAKNGRKWENLVGYSTNALMQHLEKRFKPEMSWENYGKWHIDHIIPLSAFNYSCPEDIDFKRCWDLKNLQPLWAKENHIKHAKLSKPFQPCLKLRII